MRIVLVNGVFDIYHVGHVLHLQEAKAMGDFLIVSLTLDENVNKGPGRPLNTWANRAAVLRDSRCVGSVIPTASAVDAIRRVRPAIFCKGIDYAGGDRFSEGVVQACLDVSAELRFTTSPKMSATEIINRTRELA